MGMTGMFDCMVSSPPFFGIQRGTGGSLQELRAAWNQDPRNRRKPGHRPNQGKDYSRPSYEDGYGASEGQLSNMKEGRAMGKMKLRGTEVSEWIGCYDDSWKGLITPESFAHPAKYACGLIKRILKHLREEGRLKKGDLIADPFGGIGTGGIIAASRGYRWVGVELEPRFVEMAKANFALHRSWDEEIKPRIIQGDSRNLARLLRDADVIASNPPFLSGDKRSPTFHGKNFRLSDGRKTKPQGQEGYGSSDGQLSQMDPGTADAVLGGPPHEDSLHLNESPEKDRKRRENKGIGDDRWQAPQEGCNQGYGASDGQMGNQAGDTFWGAAREIVQQCFQVLKPGGAAVWVCKDFVRSKERVPFSDDWLRLCLACSFRLTCRHRAMLTKSVTVPTLFGDAEKKTERKSFFRRLAESKGSPRIDWEDVICLEKPLDSL